jgi:hypothetical protein
MFLLHLRGKWKEQENKQVTKQVPKQGSQMQQAPAANGSKKRQPETQSNAIGSHVQQQPQEQKGVQPPSKRQKLVPQQGLAGTKGTTPVPTAAERPAARATSPAATGVSSSPSSAGQLDEDLDAQLGFELQDNNCTAAGDQQMVEAAAGTSAVGAGIAQPVRLPATMTAAVAENGQGVMESDQERVMPTGAEASVEKLRELGFSGKQAHKALKAAGGDVAKAIEFALAGV